MVLVLMLVLNKTALLVYFYAPPFENSDMNALGPSSGDTSRCPELYYLKPPKHKQAESFVLPVFLPYVGDFSQKRVWVGLPNQFNRPTSHVNYVRGTHFKAEMHSFPISIPSIHET